MAAALLHRNSLQVLHDKQTVLQQHGVRTEIVAAFNSVTSVQGENLAPNFAPQEIQVEPQHHLAEVQLHCHQAKSLSLQVCICTCRPA